MVEDGHEFVDIKAEWAGRLEVALCVDASRGFARTVSPRCTGWGGPRAENSPDLDLPHAGEVGSATCETLWSVFRSSTLTKLRSRLDATTLTSLRCISAMSIFVMRHGSG